MNLRTVLALVVLPLAGCKKREPVHVPPPGLLNSQGQPVSAQQAPPPAADNRPRRSAEPTVYDFEREPLPADPGALQAPEGAKSAEAPKEETSPSLRDVSPDLARVLREAADGCVDMPKAAAEPGGKLTLSASAWLLPTGSVSSAQVSASGQPESALSCLQKAVLQANFGEIRAAPRKVEGSTELEIKAVGPKPVVDAGVQRAFQLNPNVARPAPPDLAKRASPIELAKPDPPDFAGPP